MAVSPWSRLRSLGDSSALRGFAASRNVNGGILPARPDGDAESHGRPTSGEAGLPTIGRDRRSGRVLRYGFAISVSTLPVLLKLILDSQGLGKEAPFLLLIPAVLICAWYGGLGPGLLATALTGIGADLFFLPPYGVVTKTADAAVALTVYGIEGIAVTWLTMVFRKSQEERVRLAGEERVARAELEAANRIRTWVHTSPMPIVSLDPEGNVTRWNPAAERIFGWTEEEMSKRRLRDALPDEWKQIDDLSRCV